MQSRRQGLPGETVRDLTVEETVGKVGRGFFYIIFEGLMIFGFPAERDVESRTAQADIYQQ